MVLQALREKTEYLAQPAAQEIMELWGQQSPPEVQVLQALPETLEKVALQVPRDVQATLAQPVVPEMTEFKGVQA